MERSEEENGATTVSISSPRLDLPLDLATFGGFFEYIFFFCLGTQPSQFIKVLNSGILLPYQHVKHKINLTLRPGITFTFLKFLLIVDTISWRHLL